MTSHLSSRFLLPLILTVAGVGIGVSVSSQWQTQSLPRRIAFVAPHVALRQSIDLVNTDMERNRKQIATLEGKLATYEADLNGNAVDQALLASIERDRSALGLTERSGAGVVLTLADSSSASGVFGAVDASLVRDVVNLLWRYSADGVAVNGERIVTTTSIDGVVNATLVNGKRTVPPYTILAIGPADQLYRALNDQQLLESVHERVALEGVHFSVRRSDVTLPPYDGRFSLEFAKAVEQP